jgi:prefoldin alpha subunit
LSKDSSDEDRLNQLVVEIRVLEGTYNELTSRQNLLERALLENRAALDAIKGLGDKPPAEVLTQIGGGAMLRSPPPETERILVNVGSNVVIERPREEAVALMESRGKELEKTLLSIVSQRNEIAERLESDRQILQSVMGQQDQSS